MAPTGDTIGHLANKNNAAAIASAKGVDIAGEMHMLLILLLHKGSITDLNKRSENMFEVSDMASEMIKQFLEGKDGPQSVRVMMTEGG